MTADDSTLVARYRDNYGIPASTPLTEAQVVHHLELERRLTRRLLESQEDTRWEVFDDAYSQLYRELPWLHEADASRSLSFWPDLLPAPPARVHEVGSGQGGLAVTLADHGYDVTASEVTIERGGDRPSGPRLRWVQTDGVHLDRFAPREHFDAVISNQVIEHLHPDDLSAHMRAAHALLRPGGRYVMNTPLFWEGPGDVSRVFGLDEPVGMHLREYRYTELARAAREAGFVRVAAAFGPPAALRRRLGWPLRPSATYERYLEQVERLLDRLPRRTAKRIARGLKVPMFQHTLLLVAYKGDARRTGRVTSRRAGTPARRGPASRR